MKNYFFKGLFSRKEISAFSNKKANDNFLKQSSVLERYCAENEQYSEQECLKILRVTGSI